MTKNHKNRCEFLLYNETLKILDEKKKSLGFASRSDALRFIIHDNYMDKKERVTLDMNTILISTSIIFGVGTITNNIFIQIAGGAVGLATIGYLILS